LDKQCLGNKSLFLPLRYRPKSTRPDSSGMNAKALAWVVALAAFIRTDSGPFHCNEATKSSLLKIKK